MSMLTYESPAPCATAPTFCVVVSCARAPAVGPVGSVTPWLSDRATGASSRTGKESPLYQTTPCSIHWSSDPISPFHPPPPAHSSPMHPPSYVNPVGSTRLTGLFTT